VRGRRRSELVDREEEERVGGGGRAS